MQFCLHSDTIYMRKQVLFLKINAYFENDIDLQLLWKTKKTEKVMM